MKNKGVYWTALLFAVVPFILISGYNHPTDDDFCTYQLFHSMSFMESLVYGFNNFTGRYTFLGLYGQLDPLYATNWLLWTRLWPIIVLVTLLASFIIFINGMAKKQITGGEKFLIFTVLVILVFQGMPFMASLFYWFTGATVYTVALAFLFLSLTLFAKALSSGNSLIKISAFAGASLFAVLAIGSNETMMSFLIPFLLVVALLYLKNGQRGHFAYTLIFLAVVCMATGVALTAPGNFKRATEMMHVSFTPMYLIKAGIKCVYLVGLQVIFWLGQIQLWIAALILAPLVNRWELGIFNFKTWTGILLAHLVVFGLLVSCALLSCLAYNDVLPRIFNVLFVVFVIGFIYLIVLLSRKLSSSSIVQQVFGLQANYSTVVFLLFFILCSISIKSNITTAWMDLLFKVREYDEKLMMRYAEIQKGKLAGVEVIGVAPLFDRQYQYPKTLFINDLTRDVAGFPNSCESNFFEVKAIMLNDCPTIESRHLKE